MNNQKRRETKAADLNDDITDQIIDITRGLPGKMKGKPQKP